MLKKLRNTTGIVTGSLLVKMILAFWVVTILGIFSVAVLAWSVSQFEFKRFANESYYQGLIGRLSDYYAVHGSFDGAGYLLEEEAALPGNQAREYLVVDHQGNILISLAQHIPPGLPSPDFIRFGYAIDSNGQVVAYLIPMRPPRNPIISPVENLKRIKLTLSLGGLAVTLIALFFGWFIARNIIRPLQDLNAATHEIAQGNLDRQVSIHKKDEIGALALSFNQMVESLKRSRDLRRQMTADIAHELRNPLSIIMGNAEALSEGVLPPTAQTLDIIYDESRHLSRLVDDLRTLSLSESGELRLQFTRVAPVELLERCAATYALRASEKAISLHVDAPSGLPEIEVDPERILQVLANLLDNSLKHTPAGGRIGLSAALALTDGVQLMVEDNGPGIDAADLPYIFDRFYRGRHAMKRIQDGSGLGLAISRALVELHGGGISVESNPGEGSRFIIQLPIESHGNLFRM